MPLILHEIVTLTVYGRHPLAKYASDVPAPTGWWGLSSPPQPAGFPSNATARPDSPPTPTSFFKFRFLRLRVLKNRNRKQQESSHFAPQNDRPTNQPLMFGRDHEETESNPPNRWFIPLKPSPLLAAVCPSILAGSLALPGLSSIKPDAVIPVRWFIRTKVRARVLAGLWPWATCWVFNRKHFFPETIARNSSKPNLLQPTPPRTATTQPS